MRGRRSRSAAPSSAQGSRSTRSRSSPSASSRAVATSTSTRSTASTCSSPSASSSGRSRWRPTCSTRPPEHGRGSAGRDASTTLTVMSAFRTIDELEVALQAADYLPDRGPLDRALPRARAREAAAARGRGRRRQDRGGEVARGRDGLAADPAPVLRGPRRRARRLRVELPAPAAAHPRRAGGHRLRGRAVRARVPDPAAAARGDRLGRAGRAPDRRDRPRRRGVRGVPARGALRLPDHDPRARHDPRPPQAGGDPHLEPHP